MAGQVFLLQNQVKRFLNKQGEWTDGRDVGGLYKTKHHDEAINQSFEAGVKDHAMRIQVVACEADNKGQPQIDPDILPPIDPEPIAEPAAEQGELEVELEA